MSEKQADRRPRGALRVLVAGGGVAALEATLALRAPAEERVSIDLLSPDPLSPDPRFWYRPLAVIEPFGIGQLHGIGLVELAAAAGATFSLGAFESVDPERHLAIKAAGAALEYDALLVASGAKPVPAVPGGFT